MDAQYGIPLVLFGALLILIFPLHALIIEILRNFSYFTIENTFMLAGTVLFVIGLLIFVFGD